MTRNVPRGSNLRTPKSSTLPSNLAERFLELQRLRKQVQELERNLAYERRPGAAGAGTDPAEPPK